MKKKNITTKAMTMAVAMSMVAGMCPSTVFAATGSQVAKDGVYTSTKHVVNNPDDENEWTEYDVQVKLTVENGKFSDIVVEPLDGYNAGESASYFSKAYDKSKGIKTKLVGQAATEDTIKSWDTVGSATRTSEAVKAAALEAIQSAEVATSIDTSALEQAIASATALNQSDYTAESWQAMQAALTTAQSALAAKESQAAVDQAAKSLNDAIGALKKTEAAVENEYSYVYVGMTWAEYWANERIYQAGNTTSSDVQDSRGEYDKGAFDTVTRATTNHGLHRGSFQCAATIYDTEGNSYAISNWNSSTEIVLTDGSKAVFTPSDRKTGEPAKINGITLDHYDVTGLKYVPVKVKTADLSTLKENYAVVENGGTLSGGYAENNLKSYSVTANVTENTYGLKEAEKSADGNTFTFSARKNEGTESGIKGQALKTATGIKPEVKTASGSYGEFLRVDLNGDYGDLGSNMQAVTWTYYGNDSTYTTAIGTYGTKFAADNWMHKSMGIQLGLTDSIRCQLPKGTDGTGYWKLTVRALGYEDYTYEFHATADNIVAKEQDATEEEKAQLQAKVTEAEGLKETDYTASSWSNLQTELKESKDLLTKDKPTESEVKEQIIHLTDAINNLEKATYVLMNIPYDEFYKAETTNNDVKVDAFTSATKNKTRTGSLAGGSYHVNSDGSDITGITYPVKVDGSVDLSKYKQVTDSDSVSITVTNRGQTSTTEYKGKDALFENESYAYYTLSETPANYKEVSLDKEGNLVFSEVKGQEAEALEGVTAELSTDTSYGDYELDLDGLPKDKITSSNVNAVVVKTTDGAAYGMRHLENIWRGNELAWSTGYTDAVHGCPTSSEHYKSMMGKTIDSIEYYTTNGLYTIDIEDLYVPVKFAKAEDAVKVADADISAGKTTIDLNLQDDFDPEYIVDGLDVTVEGNVLTYKKATTGREAASVNPGKYTLTVKDKNGKYADIVTSFILTTADMPATYDRENKKLVEAEGFEADALSAYIGNISSVNVDGTDYKASGRGAVQIIDKDGTIKTDAAPFKDAEAGKEFQITVTATG